MKCQASPNHQIPTVCCCPLLYSLGSDIFGLARHLAQCHACKDAKDIASFGQLWRTEMWLASD